MVDPQTFLVNLAIILSGVVVLFFGAVALYLLWAGVNIGVWILQRRKVDRAYKRVTHRPDGHPYPPFAEGVCTQCNRGNRRIYFAGSGHELCPACYDSFWREEERMAET